MRKVSPAPQTRTRYWSLALTGLLCAAAHPATTHAANLGIQSTSGAPGAAVQVQVFLSGGNAKVAGVQAELTWDPTCLSAVPGDGDAAECTANPAIPKNLTTKIRSASTLRALYLSMSDVEPIQQDTWLYSCQFSIDPSTTATQCPINLVNVILSDSGGNRLPVTAGGTAVQISQVNAPAAPIRRAPAAVPGVEIPGAGEGGAAGGGAAGGARGGGTGAAPGAGGSGNAVAPGLPAEQAPAAGEVAGATPEAATTPEHLTPSPARTVAAASTPSPHAATPTASAKTPTPHATTPPGTPTPHGGTPGTPKPTPKSGGQ
jgi:hypothetical protein